MEKKSISAGPKTTKKKTNNRKSESAKKIAIGESLIKIWSYRQRVWLWSAPPLVEGLTADCRPV